MQMIGERLEEARKQRGVTLAQAADATKIREEYLLSLETSDGQGVPLDRIYVRGFIRNYAKYLRMDDAKLLADYDAGIKNAASANVSSPKVPKDMIGRLELGNEAPPLPVLEKDESPSTVEGNKTERTGPRFMLPRPPAWLWPVVAGFVGIIILWVVGANIAGAMKSKQANEKKTVATSTLKMYASADVTVIVKQTEDSTTLFAGTMKRGEEKTLTKRGSVQVQYSDGNALSVEKEGKRSRIGPSGAGRKVVE